MTLLASFLLPSASLINMILYMYNVHEYARNYMIV